MQLELKAISGSAISTLSKLSTTAPESQAQCSGPVGWPMGRRACLSDTDCTPEAETQDEGGGQRRCLGCPEKEEEKEIDVGNSQGPIINCSVAMLRGPGAVAVSLCLCVYFATCARFGMCIYAGARRSRALESKTENPCAPSSALPHVSHILARTIKMSCDKTSAYRVPFSSLLPRLLSIPPPHRVLHPHTLCKNGRRPCACSRWRRRRQCSQEHVRGYPDGQCFLYNLTTRQK